MKRIRSHRMEVKIMKIVEQDLYTAILISHSLMVIHRFFQ